MRPPHRADIVRALVLSLAAAAVASGGAIAAPATGPPGNKVTICHHSQGKNGTHWITITVGLAAVPAHIRNHHDTVGPCPTPPNATPANRPRPGAATPTGHGDDTAATKSQGHRKSQPPATGDAGKSDHHGGNAQPGPVPTETTPAATSDPPPPAQSSDHGGGNGNGNANGHK